MPTYDNALTSTVAFGEALTGAKDAQPLTDTLTFVELFCVQVDSNQPISDTLTFTEALIGTKNFVSEASTPSGGLDDPPHGISSSLALRRRLADPLIFEEKLDVVGGLIIDTGCTPNTLTPNFPTFCWYRLSEDDWANLDEDQYAWLDEICGDPPTLDDTILGYNPLLYYNFENVVGSTVPDLAPIPHNGTLIGGASITAASENPPGTNVLQHSSGGGVSIPNTFTVPAGPITVCFWIYVSSSGPSNPSMTFVLYGAAENPSDRTLITLPWNDGNIYWDHGFYSTTGRIATVFGSNFDRWIFVVARSKGLPSQWMDLSFDGVIIASGNNSGQPAGGNVGGSIGLWPGVLDIGRDEQMDNFAVFPEYLSDEKVKAIINAGRGHW